MLGAIAGDVIGSVYEGSPLKSKEFELFQQDCQVTDDTVLTVAVAHWLLDRGALTDYLHDYFHYYPLAGYGGNFIRWAGYRRREPYNSWGNGSAMRVSPVAYASDDLTEVLELAKISAIASHDHPEGVKGAQATATAIFLARRGENKDHIKKSIVDLFGYDLNRTLDEIRPSYTFDVSCQGSVPESIIAFLESTSVEDAIRNAISLGGDADTMACIAGSIAEAFYEGIPEEIEQPLWQFLDPRLAGITRQFMQQFVKYRIT